MLKKIWGALRGKAGGLGDACAGQKTLFRPPDWNRPGPRSLSGASRVEFFTGRQYGFMKISSKK